ncbi:MAG: glycosyltransferase, partial [Prochlorotrichaceae cyanobacterium]
MKSLNILISAYACRPNMGSEPGVGWNTACEIAHYAKVWVITREDNRSFIESERAKNVYHNLDFIYCDLPGALRWLWPSGTLCHYYLWQIVAYLTVRPIFSRLQINLIHHVTYVRYSTPSFLAFLPIPLVWGSVGGAEAAPIAFWQDFNFRARVYEFARGFAHWLGEKDPFTRITAQRSALVRVTTEDTAKRIRKIAHVEPEIFPESALATEEIEALSHYPQPPRTPIRFISMARLLHWKGLHLGIRSFAAADLPHNAEYWICGEGPEKENLEMLAQSLGVSDRVKLLGRLPRNETLDRLS